jgi:hypothetical protein
MTTADFIQQIYAGIEHGLNTEEQIVWAEGVIGAFIVDLVNRVENLEKNSITIGPVTS